MGAMDIQVGDDAPSWFMYGTTCSHHENTVYWICQNRRYFVLKHRGHSEWGGGYCGNLYCGTVYYLFDWESERVQKRKAFRGVCSDDAIFTHEGRWTKAVQEEMETQSTCGRPR